MLPPFFRAFPSLEPNMLGFIAQTPTVRSGTLKRIALSVMLASILAGTTSATLAANAASTPLPVKLTVNPMKVTYKHHATIKVVTTAGATCSGSISYANKRSHTVFGAAKVGKKGSISWIWLDASKSKQKAVAQANCTLGASKGTKSVTFKLVK
jgi:hypothetical protein